ncbi:LysE family translocator [Alteromonas sp. 5E99-2]|uniref:LysE family translocator n=1 Tax=Alteromonas sp. 5E99-2 TaxID=2817683 RepID=UPI001F622725|nr:LysE family translocator [Alteromonas sp. 5E99-2]
MALFALAASISPGPVNLVSLSATARYGVKSGLIFVTGATLGFVLLFLIIGLGLHYFIAELPWLTQGIQWLGIGFLLYLSYQLYVDTGEIKDRTKSTEPKFFTGAIMQWLNPKAWVASMSGISAYIPQAKTTDVFLFAGVYLPICWLSLTIWVMGGLVLGHYFQKPNKIRTMNKVLAILLVLSCFMIIV